MGWCARSQAARPRCGVDGCVSRHVRFVRSAFSKKETGVVPPQKKTNHRHAAHLTMEWLMRGRVLSLRQLRAPSGSTRRGGLMRTHPHRCLSARTCTHTYTYTYIDAYSMPTQSSVYSMPTQCLTPAPPAAPRSRSWCRRTPPASRRARMCRRRSRSAPKSLSPHSRACAACHRWPP